jgi:DNA-directed RNA polymerase I, II, and III subunit RPABC4
MQSPVSSPSPSYASPTSYSSPMSPVTSPHQGSMASSPFGGTDAQPYTNQRSQQAQASAAAPPTQVTYICGYCGIENAIKVKDTIRCRECGYRIMYKNRTKRKIQFEAR